MSHDYTPALAGAIAAPRHAITGLSELARIVAASAASAAMHGVEGRDGSEGEERVVPGADAHAGRDRRGSVWRQAHPLKDPRRPPRRLCRAAGRRAWAWGSSGAGMGSPPTATSTQGGSRMLPPSMKPPGLTSAKQVVYSAALNGLVKGPRGS